MATGVDALIETLDLERLETNLFRGTSPQVGWQRVFGGQVIGQALVAAIRTVDPARIAHSLHGYFMRPGDPKVPIIYDVARDRDGGSFDPPGDRHSAWRADLFDVGVIPPRGTRI